MQIYVVSGRMKRNGVYNDNETILSVFRSEKEANSFKETCSHIIDYKDLSIKELSLDDALSTYFKPMIME